MPAQQELAYHASPDQVGVVILHFVDKVDF